MSVDYKGWLSAVEKALNEINMSMSDWQTVWPFDFDQVFLAGVEPCHAALAANSFWWKKQEGLLIRANDVMLSEEKNGKS
jgi:hypothetical protein